MFQNINGNIELLQKYFEYIEFLQKFLVQNIRIEVQYNTFNSKYRDSLHKSRLLISIRLFMNGKQKNCSEQ